MNLSKYILSNDLRKNPPIWIMRQAGRYLPEYLQIRKEAKNFLDFCYNEELACEATLQPIRRYNFDSAIIFSDILVIPDNLGIKVNFIEKEGPIIEPVRNINDLLKLTKPSENKLFKTYKAINMVRNKLDKTISLIGFSGGIWTLYAYITEGKGSKDLSIARSIFYNDQEFFKKITEILILETANHLIKQVKAGADIIQIFDSYASMVREQDYEKLIIEPTNKLIDIFKKECPSTPIICFPRGSGNNYKKFCEQVNCDVIGVDQFTDLNWMREICGSKIIQGNLDPAILLCTSVDLIKENVDFIIKAMDGKKFIFNLGHGILPSTPTENVNFLVNYIKNLNK